MENDLKGIENYFELTGGSSSRGFESRLYIFPLLQCGFSCCQSSFLLCNLLFF